MSLTLGYSAKTSIPVEVDGVLPDRLAGPSLVAEIERLEVVCGTGTGNAASRRPVFRSPRAIPPMGELISKATYPACIIIGAGMTRPERSAFTAMRLAAISDVRWRAGGSKSTKRRRLARRRDARRLDPGCRQCR